MTNLNFLQTSRFPLKYLKFLGLWKVQNVKLSHRVLQICVHLFFCEMFLLLQLINIFTASNVNDISDLLSNFLAFVGLSVKSLHLTIKSGDIAALIDDAKELERLCETAEPLKDLQRRVKQVHRTYKFYLVSGFVTLFFMTVDIIATFIMHPNPPYKVLYKFWTPFDYEQNIFWFSVVVVYQITNILGSFLAVMSLDILPIFFLNFSSGLIGELAEKLEMICYKKTDVIVSKDHHKNKLIELNKCVELHLKVKAFVKKTQDIFSPVIFAQGAMSLIILCTVVFRLSEVKFFKFF